MYDYYFPLTKFVLSRSRIYVIHKIIFLKDEWPENSQDILHQTVILFVDFSRIIKIYFEYTRNRFAQNVLFKKDPLFILAFASLPISIIILRLWI